MKENGKYLFSIVVPVYNSEKSLEILYERIEKVFHMMDEEFELILVDDSSKDASFKIMKELHEKDNRVKIIQFAKNFGQHKAIMCGFHYAQGDFIITMDDDLQHPPEEIPKLIEAIRTHLEMDVIIGRYDTKKHNVVRNLGTACMNKITSAIFKKDTTLKLTSFRIMRRHVVTSILESQTVMPRIGTMLLQVTNRIMNIEVHHDARAFGKSGYSFKRLVKDFMNNILNNSDIPLRFLGTVGVVSFALSIIFAIYYIGRYLIKGVAVQGWTTLVVLLLLFFGLTLFSLGLLGNYMLRILKETKKMPLYSIRDIEM